MNWRKLEGESPLRAAVYVVTRWLFWVGLLLYSLNWLFVQMVATCDTKYTVRIKGVKYCTDTWPTQSPIHKDGCYVINRNVVCGTMKVYPND